MLPTTTLGPPCGLARAAYGWALPEFGVTLAAFLVIDAVAGIVRRGRVGTAS